MKRNIVVLLQKQEKPADRLTVFQKRHEQQRPGSSFVIARNAERGDRVAGEDL